MTGESTSAARIMTALTIGSSSASSLSSSSYDRWEFYELIRMADEYCRLYSDATCKVGWLELCLDTIGLALFASDRETTGAR